MADVRIRGAMPKGDGDGLSYHADALIADPLPVSPRLALGLLDVRQLVTDPVTRDSTAVVGFRRVELILDTEDRQALMRIMMRAAERRSGAAMLPIETEQEIEQAFAEFAEPPEPDEPGGE